MPGTRTRGSVRLRVGFPVADPIARDDDVKAFENCGRDHASDFAARRAGDKSQPEVAPTERTEMQYPRAFGADPARESSEFPLFLTEQPPCLR